LKATITQEAPVYTLEVAGQKITGMRQEGALGAVLLLKSTQGHEAYVFDGTSPIAKAFTLITDKGQVVTLIAANQILLEAINPPKHSAPECPSLT